LSNKNNL